uniref:Uncharacterized protein n=1 Tax=Panagrolaimus sp. ES5 TaxID=591445 RepID=A0AC34GE82_9BILA
MAKFQHQKLVDEDTQFAKLKNQISFAHCNYALMEEKEFNTQFCGDRSREYAFAWRYFKTNSTNETCFDIHEQVDCHTYLIQNRISNFERPENFSMCGGLLNVPVNASFLTESVWGPQIHDLSQYLNKIFHSTELFVKCPKCAFSGNQFHYPRKEEQCYQKIETLSSGWP